MTALQNDPIGGRDQGRELCYPNGTKGLKFALSKHRPAIFGATDLGFQTDEKVPSIERPFGVPPGNPTSAMTRPRWRSSGRDLSPGGLIWLDR
jgi:hypothetical protein